MRRCFSAAVMAPCILVLGVGGAHAAIYTYTPISVPGATDGTFAAGLNDLGQVVGSYYDYTGFSHGFLYSAGSYTEVVVPDAIRNPDPRHPIFPNVNVTGINNQGQIVGSYQDGSGGYQGFLGTLGNLATITSPDGRALSPAAINDSGVVAGT